MEKIIKKGKHDFKVIISENYLIKSMDDLNNFEEETFSHLFEIPDNDGYLTKDEYIDNFNTFKELLLNVLEKDSFDNIINAMDKKKNGTFYKRRVYVLGQYNNSTYFCEWNNSWNTYELRFSAIDDLTIELQLVSKTIT